MVSPDLSGAASGKPSALPSHAASGPRGTFRRPRAPAGSACLARAYASPVAQRQSGQWHHPIEHAGTDAAEPQRHLISTGHRTLRPQVRKLSNVFVVLRLALLAIGASEEGVRDFFLFCLQVPGANAGMRALYLSLVPQVMVIRLKLAYQRAADLDSCPLPAGRAQMGACIGGGVSAGNCACSVIFCGVEQLNVQVTKTSATRRRIGDLRNRPERRIGTWTPKHRSEVDLANRACRDAPLLSTAFGSQVSFAHAGTQRGGRAAGRTRPEV